MFDLTAKRFNNETAARKHLEAVRWPGSVGLHGFHVLGHSLKPHTERKPR